VLIDAKVANGVKNSLFDSAKNSFDALALLEPESHRPSNETMVPDARGRVCVISMFPIGVTANARL
jgi:hypothetical protein